MKDARKIGQAATYICARLGAAIEPIKLGDDPPSFVLTGGVDSFGLTGSTGFGRFLYFNKTAGMNVIDIAVNRNIFYDQRMLANTAHVMKDARRLIPNSVPFYKFA